ncbi:hypothetical protein M493_02185 [Geobacillus genomosp. 3]|uniref:Uncharacterized protein n=1 Tax=Geobacillus genomosp. 3 TaxID=1921421 RepID=S5ZZZ2_GEOG3|nr:hypothetical protein M493_02185 [Geobacillus genomosp. 3]
MRLSSLNILFGICSRTNEKRGKNRGYLRKNGFRKTEPDQGKKAK